MNTTTETICTLELGSSRVTAAIGVVVQTDDGAPTIDLLGVGTAERRGLVDGYSVSPAELTSAIGEAYRDAMSMAKRESVDSVWFGVPSAFARTERCSAEVSIRGRTVVHDDWIDVLSEARATKASEVEVVLHQLVGEVRLDGRATEERVVGRSAKTLAVSGELVITSKQGVEQVIRAAELNGLVIDGIMLDTIAACCATVPESLRARNVCLVDVGERSTSIGVWRAGRPVFIGGLQTGGEHVTRGVADFFDITERSAAQVIRGFGCARVQRVPPGEHFMIETMAGGSKRIPRKQLAHVLEPLCSEQLDAILGYVNEHVDISALDAGIVFTGGLTQMSGYFDVASESCKTRGVAALSGVPGGVRSQTGVLREPRYATTVGLMLEAAHPDRARAFYGSEQDKGAPSLLERARSFLRWMF